MIILSQTYQTVTPESAEDGELSDSGYEWAGAPHGFRETVELIRSGGFTQRPDSHGVPRWLSTDAEEDFRTGESTTRSLHPEGDARSQRYWAKACRATGVSS